MSREILFKAKRVDNGEWVEGDLLHLPHGIVILANGYANIIPDTICQYTGLTDKNGKKIWENDICYRHEPFPEIVKQHKGDWTLDYSYVLKEEYGYNYCNLGFYVCDRACVEVIGNIFDNPELLEGGADHERD